MVISRCLSVAALATSVLTGCDVRGPEVGSGGVDFPDAGHLGDGAAAGASCPSGLYVVNTDFQSSTVSILDSEANVLSETFVSSASGSVGLSEPLSGDVNVPTQPVSAEHVVLVDSKVSVVGWVDVRTPQLQSQLRVGAGFFANPHDYVEVPGGRAYVTRFEPNRAPGDAPFDSGNDVAIVDLEAAKLIGTISFDDALEGVASEYLARPDTLVRVGRYVYVLLNMSTHPTYEAVDGRLAVVDTQTDTVVGVLELSGLANCVGIALSPSQASLAITCSGTFDGEYYGFEQSALVLVDIDGPRLDERARWGARELGAGPLGFYVSFATETLVAATTFPRLADAEPNYVETLLTLHTESGSAEILLDAAQPYTFGHVECLPGCGRCFLADKGRNGGVLHQFRVAGDHLEPAGRIRVDGTTGLPPWAIGVLR